MTISYDEVRNRISDCFFDDDGSIGCPYTTEPYDIKQFSHWCKLEHPGEENEENASYITQSDPKFLEVFCKVQCFIKE